jgi:hypothetical protein
MKKMFEILKRFLPKRSAEILSDNSLNHKIYSEVDGTANNRSSMADRSFVLDEFVAWENGKSKNHAGHAFASDTLRRIEEILPQRMEKTAETGCGKSTILFSNISMNHFVFALDDRNEKENSSVLFYEECPITKNEVVKTFFGPTQETLLRFKHEGLYDAVLIDGPHGWPFPEFEYMMFYPYIKHGGYLVLDDVNIPTIGKMADVLVEDEMWELIEIVQGTAIFKRTDAQAFSSKGDGWWLQKYNRRRVSSKRDIFLGDEASVIEKVTSLKLDKRIHGDN